MISCLTMLVGCARNDGRKTFEFLKAEHDIIENAKIELQQCSNPKPPIPPAFLAGKGKQGGNREQSAEIKDYHAALNAYWNTVVQNCQQAERILNGTEAKMSGLDSAGVEDDAINLAKSYVRSIGDQVQVIVEVEALAKLEQPKLRQNGQSKLIFSLVAGLLEKPSPTALALTLVKDALNNQKQEIDQDQETQSHFTRLQESIATLNHDIADAITKRTELLTSYHAKYPKFVWNELLPTVMQTDTNQVNQ
jgi:hypothetical protein